MWIAVRAVIVCSLVLGCARQEPIPARSSAAIEIPYGNVVGFFAGVVHRTPGLPEGLQDGAHWWDDFDRARRLLKDLKPCFEAGFTSPACNGAAWAGACHAFLELGIEMAPEFRILGLPFAEICKGEPTLKCCKYDPATEVGCHTAFNDPDAINCEGNPSTPFAESYGPCISTDDPLGLGCTCCGIPECVTDACAPAILGSPASAAWRTDTLAKKIAAGLPPAAAADPDGAIDFVTLSGCTAHRAAILEIAPFAFPDSVPTDPDPGPGFHASDNDPDARYLRGLMTIAVRRVLGGIPNGIARWEAISERLWTDAEIAAAAATVGDADAILRRLLGDFGVSLLQSAEPRLYKLLAVPLPAEAPGANDTTHVAGCFPGTVPSVFIQIETLDNTATVQLDVQDALADRMPAGHYPAAIDWGDSRLEHLFLLSASQPIVHGYAAAGSYPVRAFVVNAARLVGTADGVAAVAAPSGPVDPGPPTVRSVSADLTAVVFSNVPPRMTVAASAIDPDAEVYPLGHLYAAAAGHGGGYATDRFAIPGTLAHFRATPVSAMQLSTTWAGGNVVSTVDVLLGDVRLTGWDGSLTAIHPSPADVEWVPVGASSLVAARIDPATRAVVLPAGGETVTVRLPVNAPPFAGCRPLTGGGTPAMITDGGGCREVSSGLTWSIGSPPLTYAAAQAYCAGLTEGGVTGWRLPTYDELSSVAGAKAAAYFALVTKNVTAWSTTGWFGYMQTRNLDTGGWDLTWPTSTAVGVCVR
jgi:hypothetical protein